MSKLAIFCLTVATGSGVFLIVAPDAATGWQIAAQGGLGLGSVAFLGAMFVGRRIKFDPILR
ncbi:hypothetical protein N8H22_16150 [Stutzerimonas stutzeri]|uniref:PA3371 family protein n=1 Tax=Stutzerimonas sp. S1 TaxID=3030652 RepID=UPI002224C8B9|nr:PA3371 family protein [Stutzerimonas sp. S1]MCW3150137.1 hypothetical protein [Stutzerimonas sp. S1]